MRQAATLATLIALFVALAVPTNAAVIGPGTSGGSVGSIDTPDGNGRTNVDLTAPVTLGDGVYRVATFDYFAAGTGNVTPFLATANVTPTGVSSDSFSVVAAGANQTVSTTGVQSVDFASHWQFLSVTSPTTYYAGITNINAANGGTGGGNNPVSVSYPGGAFDDHNAPAFSNVGVGSTLTGFSNPGLGREYNFDVQALAVNQQIGPGVSLGSLQGPDNGPRINIDQVHQLTLPAGTYSAAQFEATFVAAGEVAPFLATIDGSGNYHTLVVGSDQTVAAGGTYDFNFNNANGLGTYFTLNQATTLYAGITQEGTGVNSVGFIGGTFPQNGNDYHTPTDGIGYTPVAGTQLPADAYAPGLDRQYAFAVQVFAVPEPSSMALFGLGMAGLLVGIRRQRAKA